MKNLILKVGMHSRPQIVSLASYWSKEIAQFMNMLSDPVCIITCAVEAVIKSQIEWVCFVLFCKVSLLLLFLTLLEHFIMS